MNWSQLFSGMPLFMFSPDDPGGGGGQNPGANPQEAHSEEAHSEEAHSEEAHSEETHSEETHSPKNWATNLPDEIQEWDEVKNSDSPEKFWDQMKNMRSFLGQSIRIPSAEAGEEDWKKFNEKLVSKVPSLMPKPNLDDSEATKTIFKSLGHPDEADGYKVPELPSDIELDTSPIDEFKPIAHKHNLTQKQFEGIIKDMTDLNIQKFNTLKENHNKNAKALQQEWGQAYDKNLGIVKNLVELTDAPDNLKAALNGEGVNKDTALWLYGIAQKLDGAEGLNLSKDKTKQTGVTPAEAKEQINEMLNNRQHPYWDSGHPQHKDAIKKMIALQKAANPSASMDINDLRAGSRGVIEEQ